MNIIYTIATCFIAIFTGISIWLVLKIKSRDDDFRQQVSDLYKAIIISNLISSFKLDDTSDGSERLREAIELFTREYQKIGKTPIFILRGHRYTEGKVI